MKKDIAVIREAIKKVVNLLTSRSIKVTQRGSKAYVQYNSRNGKIELVNLPYMPDDSSDEFVAAVQGFLDHEVGHVLYTDPKIIPKLKKESSKVKNLANAIEDVYIERKMTSAFSGSVGNLNAVRRFYLDKIAKPKIDEAIAAGDPNAAVGYAALVQFRAWGGQQMAADFLRDNPKYAELVKPLEEKLGDELIAKIKKANSSWECLDLAKKMTEKLSEPKKEEPPGAPSDEDSKGAAGDKSSPDEGEEGGGSDADTKDKSKAEDPGTVKTETDDSDKEREERSETTEDVTPEAGDSEGSEGGDREEAADDDASAEPSSESDGADADNPGDDDSADPGDDQFEGDEGDDTSLGAPLDVSDDEALDETLDDGRTGGSEDTEDATEPMPSLADVFEDERDFDEDMSKLLTEKAREEISESKYQVFSTDWDQVGIPAPKTANEAAISKMVDSTQHMIAGIQKGLERALAAKARKTWNPGQRRGRIAPGALFKTAVGDDRVFRQRYETQAKNTAVSLLVDCSGSMSWGDKIGVAGTAAFALASTLERLKITNEVIGFTTRRVNAMTSAMKSEGLGIQYARTEALYMPLFKGFGERLTVDAKSRLAHLTEHHCHGWLSENVDGECLQIAATRLKQQRAERHLLIVLSDGQPACPGSYYQLTGHLSQVANSLEKDGIEVVGIGIQNNSVTEFYRKNVVLNNIADLPTTVVSELAKVLLS